MQHSISSHNHHNNLLSWWRNWVPHTYSGVHVHLITHTFKNNLWLCIIVQQLCVKNSTWKDCDIDPDSGPRRGRDQAGLLWRAARVGHHTTPGRTVGLDQGSANYSPGEKSSLTPTFINKGLLEHRMTCPRGFHATLAELSSCDADRIAHKASNIDCLVLYRRSSLTLTQMRVWNPSNYSTWQPWSQGLNVCLAEFWTTKLFLPCRVMNYENLQDRNLPFKSIDIRNQRFRDKDGSLEPCFPPGRFGNNLNVCP